LSFLIVVVTVQASSSFSDFSFKAVIALNRNNSALTTIPPVLIEFLLWVFKNRVK